MDGVLTNEQAAAYIGCTPGTLRVWVSKRRIPFVRVGRLIRFRKTDLDDYLDKNAVPADSPAEKRGEQSTPIIMREKVDD